jgi:hypothetical protein
VLEDQGAVLLVEMLIKAQTRSRTPEHTGERCLPQFQRIAPQSSPLRLDQVEGIEEDIRVMAPVFRERG